jgi:CHAT domain-containing protein/tetratricopeptide (TPR) repeat protein
VRSLSTLLLLAAVHIGWPAGTAAQGAGQLELEAGLAAFERGAFDTAVERFTQAARVAQQRGDHAGQIVALVHAAEGYAALGSYRQAVATLDRALQVAEASQQREKIPRILARLGSVLLATGPPQTAEATLKRALEMAREAGDRPLTAGVLNDIGNQLTSRKGLPEAVAAYRESATLAASSGQELLAASARINEARALRQAGATAEARAALDDAFERLERSNPSQQTAFALVAVGVGYRELRAATPDPAGELLLRAARALDGGRERAERLGDRRTVSYAQGYLGALYEDERRYDEALLLSGEAILAAQQASAPESLHRWQWQSARLHRKMGNADEAMAAYRAAAAQVASMRPELAVRYGELTTSFRESIGPLYLEFVDLLLRRAGEVQAAGTGGNADPGAVRALLVEARETVEVLKVTELRDYFRDDCVDIALSRVRELDVVSPTAAVVYPIMLADRTELLVTLPSGLRRFTVPIGEPALTKEIRQFRRMLERRTTRQYLRHSRQLYDWLIRPLEAELTSAGIDSIVFVPDGPLRTIPMGALHDGQRFLVEKYALAITPGLKLTDPRPLDRKRPRILAVGVTEAVQGFPPLPEVEAELIALREVFGGTTLLNAKFSVANIERELKTGSYTIVHVASHGEFGGDVDKTFLLAFDGKLTIDRLDQLIGLFKYRDEPLELLTLSACDTAEGDDRAALGLAGVAVKAGARSAVATLWSVNDEASAELVADFYRELKRPEVSRAVALQRAQVKLLSDPRYRHPGFWSPFLLINNWL